MKKLKWGFLSTAKIGGKSYVPAIRESENGTLYAVASRDLEKAEAFKDEHGFEKAYGSYEELLGDPEVEAIYNPLPVSMHAQWTINALQAGKPVLCEKPFAWDTEEAMEMVNIARAGGIPLAEAVMYRYHPVARKVVELVRGGAIGELRVIESRFHGVEYDLENIRFRKDLGGGVLLDLGLYCVNVSRLVAGEEPDKIEAVGRIGEESGVDESVSGVFHFPSGTVASFACSMGTQFDCAYSVTGTKGRIDVPSPGMLTGPKEAWKIVITKGSESEELVLPQVDHYRLMAEAFADHVLNGSPLEWPAEDAIANMKVIDAVLQKVQGH